MESCEAETSAERRSFKDIGWADSGNAAVSLGGASPIGEMLATIPIGFQRVICARSDAYASLALLAVD